MISQSFSLGKLVVRHSRKNNRLLTKRRREFQFYIFKNQGGLEGNWVFVIRSTITWRIVSLTGFLLVYLPQRLAEQV